MLLRPTLLLLLNADLIETIHTARRVRVLLNLLFGPPFVDGAEVLLDLAFDPGFLPGFATGRFFLCSLVRFPAAFGEDPAFARGGLDEEDLGAVCGEGDYACYESFAVWAVAVG